MMAHLASLPNELVRMMFTHVRPEDLENFAQISRQFHSLALPFLVEHRALIRKYRNTLECASITAFLHVVITNPRIASYVKKVELLPLATIQNALAEDELEIVTTAAVESECLRMVLDQDIADEKEYWRNEVRNGDEDILLAILLTLLPNLTVLSMNTCHDSQSKWYASVIEKANSATKPTLSKLKHIQLLPGRMCGCDVLDVQKFSALSSVKVLSAEGISGWGCLPSISSDMNSEVTDLKLWDSSLEPAELYEFLRGFTKLQNFTFSSYIRSLSENGAFMIRSRLLAYCKATLRSLTLLCPDPAQLTFMGSLRDFEMLREIYTEWSFLDPDERGILLNERMPASLVRLKLHDNFGYEKIRYEKVIENAQFAKEHRLQKLVWFGFGGIKVRHSLQDIDSSLREACSDSAISLAFSPYAPKSGDLI